jgi:hypothetical protein
MSACSKHPVRLGERLGRVPEQHVPPSAKHAIDGLIRQIERLGVEDAVLDTIEPEPRALAPLGLDHRRCEVADDKARIATQGS